MAEADYIVIRGTEHDRFDGYWYDRSERMDRWDRDPGAVAFEPTGEFEVRSDGAVAEVWRPLPGEEG